MKHRLLLMILLILSVMAGAGAQEPGEPPPAHPFMPPLPERFEEAMDIAMHESPDVVMARLEVQRAAAELRQVRMEVIREITRLWQEKEHIQEMLGKDEADVDRSALNMELDNISVQLRYLIGMGVPMEGAEPEEPRVPMMPMPRPAMNDAMRQQLQKKVTLSGEKRLGETLDYISELTGVPFIPDFEILLDEPVSRIRANDMTLEQVMRSLTDQMEFLAFVIRDYGILVTHRERAMRIDAPAIPENLPLFQPEVPGQEPVMQELK